MTNAAGNAPCYFKTVEGNDLFICPSEVRGIVDHEVPTGAASRCSIQYGSCYANVLRMPARKAAAILFGQEYIDSIMEGVEV